ncbi:FKRP protein, partial [Heliornis fulica]|nr:FKRP protein [Heliornis fulica]
MRLKLFRAALALAIGLNLLLLFCAWRGPNGSSASCRPPRGLPGVTVLLRDFEDFENDLLGTARSFASLAGPVMVVAETPPYPPLPLPPGVDLLLLHPEADQPPPHPELRIRTRHVALIPDGTRALPGLLERMRKALEEDSTGATRMVAAPVGPTPLRCLDLRLEARRWTARYGAGTPGSCGAVEGPAVLLLRTRDLFLLPFPLARPVPVALFLQAALRGWGLHIMAAAFPAARRPPLSPHGRWKSQNLAENRRRRLMGELGVKLEVLANGQERWYGCGKETPRCFGTVHARTPQYLLSDRWTPPCCLRALRETTRHVTEALEAAGVRYWLEGGSLLGAVRLGDIIPWDYDVDLGIYREDLGKCRWLAAAAAGEAVEDPQGFLWEKASEGEFYRVHYSRTNRLHVDLWPDVEFPESFLVPRVPMAFAGGTVMAPNEARRFLELKFGPGAIENPEYPNP